MSDFKSTLNQYCQKFRVSLPKYSTKQTKSSKGIPIFTCSLQIHDGGVFESQGIHGSKKSAEQSTAEQALRHLLRPPTKDIDAPSSTSSETSVIKREVEKLPDTKVKMKDIKINLQISDCQVMSPDSSSSATPQTTTQQKPNNKLKTTGLPPLTAAKSLLNEHALRHHLTMPAYETSVEHGGFVCTVSYNNVKYKSKGVCRVKKEAERSAALEAVLALQIHNNVKQSSSSVSQSPSTPQSNTRVSSSKSTPDGGTPPVLSFKNLLQEYTQQRRRGENPKYETQVMGKKK